MIHGSCLCGSIRWQIDGALSDLVHCHCSMCRKAHGTAFATYAVARLATFSWRSGENSISAYESSPGFRRTFCAHCGAVVPHRYDDDRLFVPVGGLDEPLEAAPAAHIFVIHRAPWHRIADTLPQHDAYPPGTGVAPVHRPAAGTQAGTQNNGAVTGSCLCGSVAFRLTAPLTAAYHCHCGRCRKARAAAHASNARAADSSLEFTRGEHALVTFKLPGAAHFTQVFCTTCGSAMPRVDAQRKIVSIPLGSLDDEPGLKPDHHIFVGSKALWYTIADDLPQFDERPAGE